MELYLDSVDFKEVEEAMKLGIVAGLTTTPTFMHRQGIQNVDEAIVKLSQMVPILQIEALGDTPDEIVNEAHRLLGLGLDETKTVFKIPISNIGIIACKRLRDQGLMVNLHLIYTVNQAYMAMEAGATYACVLVGRMQDQGHDSLTLVGECIETALRFGYNTKIMFSSVRHVEHVRNAILLGAHTATVPWSVMRKLTENSLTTIGTDQFTEHTKLMTVKVKEVIRAENPTVTIQNTVLDALVKMTESKFGAVSVLNTDGSLKGIFTDGDVRRHLKDEGKDLTQKNMGDFEYSAPTTISADALLYEAVDLFRKKQIDNIIVTDNNRPIGILDIQDFVKMKLIG